jgi:hypothetical protein
MEHKREKVEKAAKVCGENKQLFSDIGISEFTMVCDAVVKTLYAIKLEEDYGIKNITRNMVRGSESNVYVRINDYMYIASMGEKYRRTISWSADGRQPEDEIMLVLSFPTGAYIFGDSYPTELFARLWEEIKSYGYKYVDDMNHNVYFSLDTAAPIANGFRDVLNRYYKIFKEEANIRRAEELKKELARLEENLTT